MTLLAKGLDYSYGRPAHAEIVKAGFRFVVRYVGDPGSKPDLTMTEAELIRGAGLDLCLVHQKSGGDAKGGAAAGKAHALALGPQLASLRWPSNRPVYFAADWDVQPSEYLAVDAYFRAVAGVRGVGATGAYGHYALIEHLFDKRLIAYGWQTSSWSNSQWSARAQLRQTVHNTTFAGQLVDVNEAYAADYGQEHPPGGEWWLQPLSRAQLDQLGATFVEVLRP